jgi:magnesium chelatase family protein
MLVAAMNPCPCGFYNHPEKECSCGQGMIRQYLSRISGPLLDRIDLQLEVVPVPFGQLSREEHSEGSESMREMVTRARDIQKRRFNDPVSGLTNARMGTSMRNQHCRLDPAGTSLIRMAMEKLGLSARAYDRILKVSRTIADLDGSEKILPAHVAEAIQYRNLDREGWSG